MTTQKSSSPTPGIIIAGASSGTGKTTIATGLMAALSRSFTVAPFKVGPDYIDPGYHEVATGRPGRNLDSVLCGEGLIGPLYRHGSSGCDVSVIEGVMGLFDGRISPRTPHIDHFGCESVAEGSTAHIAELLGMPVVLVVDVRSMSQSVAALVKGFSTLDPRVRIAGVILNQVGTNRHEALCRQSVESVGVPVLGAIPRVRSVAVPSRHLGLITTREWSAQARQAVDEMADLVNGCVDISALNALAACRYDGQAWAPGKTPGDGDSSSSAGDKAETIIALASGPAFSFFYAEHKEILQAKGCRVVEFDPLGDEDLSCGVVEGCHGLIIPGGFPEEHGAELSSKRRLSALVRQRASVGLPIHAECAGLLWLLDELDGLPMCGVIPATARMGQRLTLGYRDAVALTESALWSEGSRITGHELHHTQLEWLTDDPRRATGQPAWGWTAWNGQRVTEGWVSAAGNVHASYLHTHPAAAESAIDRFLNHCKAHRLDHCR